MCTVKKYVMLKAKYTRNKYNYAAQTSNYRSVDEQVFVHSLDQILASHTASTNTSDAYFNHPFK